MVRNGQRPPIREIPYVSPGPAAFGVEVMSFARLRSLGSWEQRAAPQRPRFHVLVLPHQGRGRMTVDFTARPLSPGDVLWIRPGRVHQFAGIERMQGELVLFRPDFLAPGTLAQAAADDPFGPLAPRPPAPALLRTALHHLRQEYEACVGTADPACVDGDPGTGIQEARAEILRALLGVLLLRLLPVADEESAGPPRDEVFARFRAAVEEDFARHRQVARYADRLGNSPRTLTRAARRATGLGAKEFIDERLLLEARRLLAHSPLSAAQCARRLGFADAANFGAFFRHRTGTAPGEFREAVRAPGGAGA